MAYLAVKKLNLMVFEVGYLRSADLNEIQRLLLVDQVVD